MVPPDRTRLPECVFASGLIAVAAGLWWIYPPVCLIVVGTLFLGLGLWGAR